MPRIRFASQAYKVDSLPLAAQRCVNWYPEIAPPGAKTPLALLATPGLTLHATVGDGPIRGMIEMAGDLYVVSGPELYKIEANGDQTNLGAMPGTSFVQMAHNGTQVLILAGTGSSDGFIATATTLANISDVDFLGSSDVCFIDGYFVLTVAGDDQFFISAQNDGTDYDALDFATAEGQPDPIVGCASDHREIWLLGAKTIEVWYNSGNADFPFERQSGAYNERGLAAKRSIVQLDNSLFWVGNDRIVYTTEGYAPLRVSDHALEFMMSESDGVEDLQAFGYSQRGHPFYVLKKPNEWTFAYDVSTGRWHERVSNGRPDYRVSTYAEAFNRHLVGDDTSGKVYFLDPDNPGQEDGATVTAIAAAPPLWNEAENAFMNNLVIDMEGGVGLTTGQGSDPQVMLRWSDDGGHTWSNEHWRKIGKKGEYNARARWDRMGMFRQRILELSISDPVRRTVLGAYSQIDRGRL